LARHGAALAALSYSLYLTHYPTIALWQLVHARSVGISVGALWFGLIAVTCLCAAVIFYWLFERHTALIRQNGSKTVARWAQRLA
jgi:peptidoglycan/LPS O-acetylase OafA/YrhL